MYRGQKLIIATKHQKEKVMVPLLEGALDVTCLVAEDLDTDLLGTFTGEISREDDVVSTAKKKCLIALKGSEYALAIASEGSFGPHPALFFVPANEELVMFYDRINDLQITAKALSTDTNFSAKTVYTENELRLFAEVALFPSHALILSIEHEGRKEYTKGIQDWAVLMDTFRIYCKESRGVLAETDMRAMYNPSRMKVIESATLKLIDKIKSLCPQCGIPGFGVVDIIPGLPCENCRFPTSSILSEIWGCIKCNYRLEKKYPNNKFWEDPMYCDVCNP